MAAPNAHASPASEPAHWLYGRWIDLLVGCCGIYTLSIPLLLVLSMGDGTATWPTGLVMLLGLTINAPHYGATLVRLYERREDRRKYVFFTVHVTIALALLFVLATRNLWLASAIITAYVTWAPWHFSAQNYGLAMMFLGREGVRFDPLSKRLFHLSFVFATAIAILGIQSASANLVFAPGTFRAPDTPRVFLWPPFQTHATVLLSATGVLYLATLGAAYVRMRATRMASVATASSLVVTQALFSAIPVTLAHFASDIRIHLAFAPFWLSMAHSAQYLWVSAYYAKRSGAQQTSARFLGKSFLAGSGITVLPAVLFAPAFLGDRPWDAGLAGLVFAMVNLHHFIMDGAIWKLRDGRVAQVLVRESEDVQAEPIEAKSRSWLRRVVYAACVLSVAVPAVSYYETAIGIPAARHPQRIDTAFDRLRLIGRESIRLHNYSAGEYAKLGQFELALRHFERSVELHPTPDGLTGVGNMQRRLGRTVAAREAYEAALAIDDGYVGALLGSAQLEALDVANPTRGAVDRARKRVERVLAITPELPEALRLRSRIAEIEARL